MAFSPQSSSKVPSVKDHWCTTPIASIPLHAAAADIDFPDVEFPDNFLPPSSLIEQVYLMVSWRKQVDSSAGANAINGASKTIRVKKSTGAWGTDDVVGITFADNSLATASNATEVGCFIIGGSNISSEVDDTDYVTYNIRSEETERGDAIAVDTDHLTLYDVYTGLRVYYSI